VNNSITLAKLWIDLKNLKDKIDNEVIPAGGYLGVEDPELMIALEELSAKIENHFRQFRLVAETRKGT
jgi:hypothetical protein